MQRQEFNEIAEDLWQAHSLLEQRRQTINPFESAVHGYVWDAIVESQLVLEQLLMP